MFSFGTILICATLIFLGYNNPLSHWGSYWYVFRATCRDKQLPKRAKLRLLMYLLRDLVLSPLHSALWILDEMIFSTQLNIISLKDPVFIVSQPRSGSTFLHRLLAEDKNIFFAVTYLEWRWPYICVWRLLDFLGIRDWVNNRSYWSKTSGAGLLANQMHPHLYGDHEEHGIFLEEKFYHHYFVFRRFPFTPLLDKLVNFNTLNNRDQERLLDVFERVIRKVAFYRGENRIWLTKENESISFYCELLKIFPRATFLFLVRDYKDMLSSYITLSRESTLAKTGVDKSLSTEWHKANVEFRRKECIKFVAFYNKLQERGCAVLINYENLTSNVFENMLRFYQYLKIDMSEERARFLLDLTITQRTRTRSYAVSNLSSKDVAGFDEFADLVGLSQNCFRDSDWVRN